MFENIGLNLIDQRRRTPRDTVEYRELNRRIGKWVRRDIRACSTRIVEEIIKENAGMKVLRSKLSPGRQRIIKLKDN